MPTLGSLREAIQPAGISISFSVKCNNDTYSINSIHELVKRK